MDNDAPLRLRLTPMLVVDRHHDLLFQIDELIAIRKKTSSMGIRDLRKIRKAVVALTKDTTKVMGLPRSPGLVGAGKAQNFARKVVPDATLRKFLRLNPGEEVTAREVMVAISTYIHRDERLDAHRERWLKLNPDHRDLRDPKDLRVTIPDAKLSQLLGYREYRERVAQGLETITRDDPFYARKEHVPITDDALRWWVVTKLAWQRMKVVPKATVDA